MAQSFTCIGHKEREERRNKIGKLVERPMQILDGSLRLLTELRFVATVSTGGRVKFVPAV